MQIYEINMETLGRGKRIGQASDMVGVERIMRYAKIRVVVVSEPQRKDLIVCLP